MLLREEDKFIHKLACPCCKKNVWLTAGSLQCSNPTCHLAGASFDRVNGASVLVDFSRSVLDRVSLLARDGASTVLRPGGWRRKFWTLGMKPNRVAPRIAADLLDELRRRRGNQERRPFVAIVGGGTVDNGARLLLDAPDIDVVSLDVYDSPNVSFIADGHDIPLINDSVDAVWIQAVLEHVVDPPTVVSEIYRILKPSGLVYSDSPFLWPVHEAAYDFVRWTASGHRWLFRGFDVVSSGTSSGPGTVAYLALKGLAIGLLRSTTLGHLAAMPFIWMHWLDELVAPRYRLNTAGGSFFFGRKSNEPLEVRSLIGYYDEQVAYERRSHSA